MVGSPASSVLRSAPTSGCPSRHGRGRVCRSVFLRSAVPSFGLLSRPGLWSPVPRPARRRLPDLPGSWGVLVRMPYSPTPVERRRLGLRRRRRVAFRQTEGVGLHDATITGLNHTAYALAVYASQLRSPAPTQDSLPAGDHDLGRSGLSPAGLQRRFLFSSSRPPSPGLSWRTRIRFHCSPCPSPATSPSTSTTCLLYTSDAADE